MARGRDAVSWSVAMFGAAVLAVSACDDDGVDFEWMMRITVQAPEVPDTAFSFVAGLPNLNTVEFDALTRDLPVGEVAP